MSAALSHSWQAPLSLFPSILYLHHFLSRFFFLFFVGYLLALFIWDSLSVSCSLSALVPLCVTSLCWHLSLTPFLSVVHCLIAIDCYRGHTRTNLIKSDKCRYFYYSSWNTSTHTNVSTPKLHPLYTHSNAFKPLFVFIRRFLTLSENHYC